MFSVRFLFVLTFSEFARRLGNVGKLAKLGKQRSRGRGCRVATRGKLGDNAVEFGSTDRMIGSYPINWLEKRTIQTNVDHFDIRFGANYRRSKAQSTSWWKNGETVR